MLHVVCIYTPRMYATQQRTYTIGTCTWGCVYNRRNVCVSVYIFYNCGKNVTKATATMMPLLLEYSAVIA